MSIDKEHVDILGFFCCLFVCVDLLSFTSSEPEVSLIEQSVLSLERELSSDCNFKNST